MDGAYSVRGRRDWCLFHRRTGRLESEVSSVMAFFDAPLL